MIRTGIVLFFFFVWHFLFAYVLPYPEQGRTDYKKYGLKQGNDGTNNKLSEPFVVSVSWAHFVMLVLR